MTQSSEDVIYQALLGADQERIDELRAIAYEADQTRPDGASEDWQPPAAVFEQTLAEVTARLQAEHEASEEDRVKAAQRLAEQETAGVTQALDAMTDAEREQLGLEVSDDGG